VLAKTFPLVPADTQKFEKLNLSVIPSITFGILMINKYDHRV
jgi:hypothetical protein